MMRDYNTQAVGIYSRAGRRNLSRLMVTSALVAAGSLALSGFAVAADYELPTGGVVTRGGATFSTPSIDKLRINQSTDRVVINWNTFNIGADATVKFVQPSSNALAVNKVSNDGQFSRINGHLLANGKVVILDPNGIIFGNGSVINVGSLLASTGDIDSDRVMAGDTSFVLSHFGTGSVENYGLISVADSGLVALVAPTVKNSGVINAKLGRVSLAAGSSTATVDLYGDGLVELAYTDRDDDLLAKNTGEINALGGTIQMSAAAAKNVVDSVVNMNGVAHANSATVTGGKIVLSARHVKVGASADVKGDTTISAKRLDLGSTIDGSVAGSAKTVNVLSDAAKIAQGLNVVDAGGTVNVAAGTYNEHLVIDKAGVTLNGAKSGVSGGDASRGTGETVVNPKSPGVTVTADGVVVDGMMFSGATGLDGYGIFVNGASNVTLRNNVITNTSKDGIYILGGANNAVLNNNIGALGAGYNIVGDGVLVKDSSNDVVQGNVISKIASPTSEVGSGVQVINGNGVLVGGALAGQGNEISDTQWDAVKVTGGSNITVQGNEGTNLKRTGIYAKNTKGLTISSNDIDGTGLFGIQVELMQGATSIEKNTIDSVKSNDGISVTFSAAPTYITGNIIGYGDDGILNTSDDTSIGRDGISTIYASNVSARGNDIAHTKRDGVNAEGGSSFYLGGNSIDFTGRNGVNLYKTSGANIVGNEIGWIGLNNNINGEGVLVDSSNGTRVRLNEITETTSTAPEVGSGVHVLNSTNVIVGGVEGGNLITNTEWDAVKVTGGSNITVQGNKGTNLKRTGIYGKDTNGLTISSNDIDGVGLFGIQVEVMQGPTYIERNTIDSVKANDGISVTFSAAPTYITGNIIGYGDDGVLNTKDDTSIGRDGISTIYASNVSARENKIAHTKRHGVYAEGGSSFYLGGNSIDFTGKNGVNLYKTSGANIVANRIGMIGLNNNINGDGVMVDSSNGTRVRLNRITETTSTATEVGSGVHVLNSTDAIVGGIESGNLISNAEWDAVKVTGGSNILVEGNRGDNLARAGIYGKLANNLVIRGNDINGAGMFGIQIDSAGTGNSIVNNTVDRIGQDGISVRFSTNPLSITGNMVGYGADEVLGTSDDQGAYRDGIALLYANNVTVSDNSVGASGRYGIYAESSKSPVISGNSVDKSRSHGIYLLSSGASNIVSNLVGTLFGNGGDSVRVDRSNGSNIAENTIWNSGHDGVALYSDSGTINVTGNEIINSAHDGVYAYNVGTPFYYYYDTLKAEMPAPSGVSLHIVNNVIENEFTPVVETLTEKAALELPGSVFGNAAIELDIGERGYAEISANTMGTNFHYGLLAESGLIDLTGESNTIHNSNIGMAFYPDNTDFEMPALVMDTAYYEYLANRLRLVDNTIGTTAFQDQSDLYVDLGYGAFFAPGYPTHLDGNHATYQQGASIIDPSLTGTITTSEYNSLEAMINHYVDSADRGLFFFNVLPEPPTPQPQAAPAFNTKDIFRDYIFSQAPGNSGSLIITGLPSVGGGIGGRVPAAPPVFALNNIAPAAGDGTFNPADIEPAAGDEQPQAQNVNNIAPAAGGEDGNNAPCWSDATRMLGAGSAVTVNFGGGADQLLNDAASCGNQNNGQPL